MGINGYLNNPQQGSDHATVYPTGTRSELKMKFDVQIKANKRLYEDTNLDNHFKAANAIVRESTSKFEELSLCYARNYFKMSKSSLTLEILGKNMYLFLQCHFLSKYYKFTHN